MVSDLILLITYLFTTNKELLELIGKNGIYLFFLPFIGSILWCLWQYVDDRDLTETPWVFFGVGCFGGIALVAAFYALLCVWPFAIVAFALWLPLYTTRFGLRTYKGMKKLQEHRHNDKGQVTYD